MRPTSGRGNALSGSSCRVGLHQNNQHEEETLNAEKQKGPTGNPAGLGTKDQSLNRAGTRGARLRGQRRALYRLMESKAHWFDSPEHAALLWRMVCRLDREAAIT